VLQPGEKIQSHIHRFDYIFYIIEGGTLEIYNEHDQPIKVVEVSSGNTFAFSLDGDSLRKPDGTIGDIGAHHSAKNIGETTFREILVEMKS